MNLIRGSARKATRVADEARSRGEVIPRLVSWSLHPGPGTGARGDVSGDVTHDMVISRYPTSAREDPGYVLDKLALMSQRCV